MNNIKKFVALVLCMTTILCGCKKTTEKEISKTEQLRPYNEAVEKMQAEPLRSYKISQKKTTIIGNQSNTEEITQTITCKDPGTEQMSATVAEVIAIGDDKLEITHTYAGGQGYLRINDYGFTAPSSPDAFLAQFAPASLLNANIYRNVEIKNNSGITIYQFTNPVVAELWSIPSGSIFVDAHGDATISKDGKLVSCTYHVTYTDGPVTVRLETTSSITYPSSIEIPETAQQGNTSVESLSAPRLMEIACLRLNNVSEIQTNASSYIKSEAFSLSREQSTLAKIAAEPFDASISTIILQTDYSKQNDPAAIEQSVAFSNGTCTTTISGITQTNTDITQAHMERYCKEILFGSAPSVAHIQSAVAQQLEDYTILRFHVAPEISDLICQQVSTTLYSDPDFIFNISSSFQQIQTEFYFTIDNRTGLPSACGYRFNTIHTVDYSEYEICSMVDQTFYLNEISSTNTEESVKPMLFSVSDGNDNTLWILGTTQYGDTRTSNLSREVYAALTDAQVLVIEYSYDALRDKYGNSDSFNSISPISEDILLQAEPHLYISGAANTVFKTSINLLNAIRHCYISSGFRLSQKNSVHNTICQFAVPSGKRIDILYPQANPLQFYANLSNEAQELLLRNTLASTSSLEENAFRLLDALYCGNDADIMELLSFDTYTDDPLILEELNQKLYTQPAEEITLQLTNYLKEGKKAFAVIDVQYLIFNGSVIDQLQQLGYTVTRY